MHPQSSEPEPPTTLAQQPKPKRPGLLLLRFYLLGFTTICVILLSSDRLISHYLRRLTSDSRVVNIAGRQRMLSQKLCKELLLLTTPSSVDERSRHLSIFKETSELWQFSHDALREGDTKQGIPGNNSDTIRAMFDDISPHYSAMLRISAPIIENKNQGAPLPTDNVQAFLSHASAFLVIMNNIVYQYDQEAQHKVADLGRLHRTLFLTSIAILVIELFFIFIPISRRLSRTVQMLYKSEAQATALAARTTELYRSLEVSHEKHEALKQDQFKRELEGQQQRSKLVLQAQEKERKRISRDIHDGLGQQLTGLNFMLQAITLQHDDPNSGRLADIQALSKELFKEVRRIAFNLAPSVLSDYGLPAALQQLATEMNCLATSDISYRCEGELPERLDNHIETNIFRISQEALTNAIRHGQAAMIEISMIIEPDCLSVGIRDDGISFKNQARTEDAQSGNGLSNMQERAALIGAELTIENSPGNGTNIILELPITAYE